MNVTRGRALHAWCGGIVHESNSFSPIATPIEAFEPWGGDASGDPRVRGQRPQWPGYQDFLDLARTAGVVAHAGFFVGAQPSAPAPAVVWSALKAQLLNSVRSALAEGALDIVWLVLHGAQLAEGCDDCEGELLQSVRALVGPQARIGVLLDLHGNLSQAMLDHADLLIACKHYPHVDFPERTAEAFDILVRAAHGECSPVMAAMRVPAFGVFPTTEPPYADIVLRLLAAEKQPGVLSASAMHGFFGGDCARLGGATLVVHDGDAGAAAQIAANLARDMMEIIRGAPAQGLSVDAALAKAAQCRRDALAGSGSQAAPVVIADRADNAGGGAAGDSTYVLAALLASADPALRPAALGLLWDPAATQAAHAAGAGARLSVSIGGFAGPLSGPPLRLDVTVLAVRDDARQAVFTPDARQALGRSAALRVETSSGPVDIVVNDLRQQTFSPHVFSAHGIEPATCAVLVVKSTQHFHAAFAPIASKVVRCDAPGTVTSDFRTLPYRHLPRPMWPWDGDAQPRPLEVQHG